MAGFCLVSLFLIASRGKGAKGVARSGFPPARGASERLVGRPFYRHRFTAFALAFPGLDARLGGHGTGVELQKFGYSAGWGQCTTGVFQSD